MPAITASPEVCELLGAGNLTVIESNARRHACACVDCGTPITDVAEVIAYIDDTLTGTIAYAHPWCTPSAVYHVGGDHVARATEQLVERQPEGTLRWMLMRRPDQRLPVLFLEQTITASIGAEDPIERFATALGLHALTATGLHDLDLRPCANAAARLRFTRSGLALTRSTGIETIAGARHLLDDWTDHGTATHAAIVVGHDLRLDLPPEQRDIDRAIRERRCWGAIVPISTARPDRATRRQMRTLGARPASRWPRAA